MLKCFAFFFFLPFSVTAQLDSATLWHKYESEVIYFSGSRYYLKGTTIHSYKELKYEFDQSPLGNEVYSMHRKDQRKYYFFFITGIALYIPAAINLVNRNYREANNFILGSIASFAISIPIANAANKKLHKAVWIRNRDTLLTKPR
jgi:hypothetical protein